MQNLCGDGMGGHRHRSCTRQQWGVAVSQRDNDITYSSLSMCLGWSFLIIRGFISYHPLWQTPIMLFFQSNERVAPSAPAAVRDFFLLFINSMFIFGHVRIPNPS